MDNEQLLKEINVLKGRVANLEAENAANYVTLFRLFETLYPGQREALVEERRHAIQLHLERIANEGR